MAQTKNILVKTLVSIVNSVISIFTYFEQTVTNFVNFFITDTETIINDVSFKEGELGYSLENSLLSAMVNDQAELVILDVDTDPYFIDGGGDLISGDVLTAPVALAATGVTSSGFTVNWEAIIGATKYYLDVALDSQCNVYVVGYQNLDVGDVVTRSIAGLTMGTTYYYRVRAYDGIQMSLDSNVILVTPSIQAGIVAWDGLNDYVQLSSQPDLSGNKTINFNLWLKKDSGFVETCLFTLGGFFE